MDDSMEVSAFEVDASSDFEPEQLKAKNTSKTAAKGKISKASTKTKKPARLESDDENAGADNISDHENLDDTPPMKPKKKAAPKAKKPAAPLSERMNDSFTIDGAADEDDMPVAAPKKTSATSQYQKLTQLEHILKRPDTYIGSVERTEQQMWVYNSENESMESRRVNFVPGLYKIFDEILVNAADNKQRDKNMNEMKVWVDKSEGSITVRNNGKGIPIETHEKEGIWIPEMIFGHLLTSSNYNDDEAKVTGGRNGYGAKLTNIYSTRFELETVDSNQKKRYKQTWTDNMSKMEKAKITSASSDKDFTRIKFWPDFKKFGMSEMDDDFEALVKRRVYDMAGTCKDIRVHLNDERIKINKFKSYMEMYTKAIKTENLLDNGTAPEQVILTDTPHERWEIGFAVSDGSFQQVSFVNSIATTQGGTHVNYIADQIVDKLEEIVMKKNKGGVKLKKAQIKNHIFLFVNCLIENPAFTSQTKEQMTTKVSAFGSKPQVSEKFLKDIAKTEAVTNIIHFAQQKADKVLAKSDGSRRQRMNNSKLTDANKAGTKDGHKCTLILTEGDSASLLALAGRAVVNPDLFGVFPLRGKLLNVRDATIDAIAKNEEIQNIKKFMGLRHKETYTDVKSLRYGRLMIMTDQDHDGSHIKGLLINFLQVQFPSLLKIEGFLLEFITPIVKTWKGDLKTTKQKFDFFTMPEYEAWKQEPGHQKDWEHKYYKGLGTSDTNDAKTYFRDLDRHLKQFEVMKEEEVELIDLAFSKKKADARKTWLQKFVPGTYLDMAGMEQISYDDFINKELILFSMADNQRSIPSVLDGFKPGQRKVLYTAFKRNLKKDMKVVSLAGAVSDTTAYPYGEASLQQTIVGLAQNFVGSNNINCLEPSGNFGSRLQGGQDAASPRYIYTRLTPFARKIFHKSDEALLTYNTDDGKQIEPETYFPVLPMILVNGADGIGTGWSTSIPNYNPEEIIENLKLRMHGDSKDVMKPMKPWFRSWTGDTEDMGNDRFKFNGRISERGEREVEITELPVRVWTQDFKNKLEDIIKAEKVPSFIKDYVEYNTPETVHFIIKLVESKTVDISNEKALEELFKLSKTMATSNMVAFDAQGRIHRYETPLDIMEEFFHVRLMMYQKRKQFLLDDMQRELERLTNQARFITMIIDNKLTVSKKKKAVLVAELQKLGFTRFPKVAEAKKQGETEDAAEDEDQDDDATVEAGANDYDYLLGMAIWSLTQERVEKLKRQIGDKEGEIDALTKKTVKNLWEEDLDALQEEWQKQLEEEAKRDRKARSQGRRTSAKLGIAGKASKKRKGGNEDDDSDGDFVATKKPKVAKGKTAAAGLMALQPAKLVNAVEQKPVIPPLADTLEVEMANANDLPATSVKPAPTTTKIAKTSKADTSRRPESAGSDVFMAVAKETAKPASKAASKTAAKKVYKIDSDSDEHMSDGGNDMLDDVSAMVKGVGAGAGEGPSRLFHPPSVKRPSTVPVAKAKQMKSNAGADDTDWEALAQNSPQKATHHSILSDDESDVISAPKLTKGKAKAASKVDTGKLKTKTATKPAKTTAKAKAKKSAYELDDSDDEIAAAPAKSVESSARPGRRAAAKPKYVIDDFEDAEEESEADFMEEDSDED